MLILNTTLLIIYMLIAFYQYRHINRLKTTIIDLRAQLRAVPVTLSIEERVAKRDSLIKEICKLEDGFANTTRIIILNDKLDFIPESRVKNVHEQRIEDYDMTQTNDFIKGLELHKWLINAHNSKITFHKFSK